MVLVKDDNENDRLIKYQDDTERKCVAIGARHALAGLGFLGLFTVYSLRTSLNVAMVAMVSSTSSTQHHNTINHSNSTNHNCSTHINGDCSSTVGSRTVLPVPTLGEFGWDEQTQGIILGAVYYGYVVSQVPGGWLADRTSGKMVLGFGCLLSALLSFLIPSAARAGSSYLIVVRILQGLAEGVTSPAVHALFAEWAPVHERSCLASFTFAGCELGTAFSMLITGLLCRYGFAGGWPSAFYVFGAMGCVWFILWMVLVSDCPAQHPRISDRERRYIQSSVGHRQSMPTPWREIVSSAAVWGVCAAHVTGCWGYYSLLTCLPTYMKHILHFDIVSNGFLSALPYLVLWLTQMLAGVVSDWLRPHLTTVVTRKLMFTIGSIVPASFLVGMSYVRCDHSVGVALLTLGVAGKGIAASCFVVNHLDIAPRFAGTIFGMSNSLGAIPGFVGPMVVGVLTNHDQTIGQWRKFFYITAGIYALGSIVFIWLGKGEEQPWAKALPPSPPSPPPSPPTPTDETTPLNKGTW